MKTKKAFDSMIYSILPIGAFVVEYLPVSIVCISILCFSGIKYFYEILDDQSSIVSGKPFLVKLIFLLLILGLLIVVVWAYLHRNKLTAT